MPPKGKGSHKRARTTAQGPPAKKTKSGASTKAPAQTPRPVWQHSPTVENIDDEDDNGQSNYEHPRNPDHILESIDDSDNDVVEVSSSAPMPEETLQEELDMRKTGKKATCY